MITEAVAKGVYDYLRASEYSVSTAPVKCIERGAEKAFERYAENNGRSILNAVGKAAGGVKPVGVLPSSLELLDLVQDFLVDQEQLKEPFRNEALCEKARAVLCRSGR